MRLDRRHLAHLGTAVLLGACAAAVGTGTPAVAAPGVDLAITASSTRIAAGSVVKGLILEVTNVGTATAHGFTVELDFGCTLQGCVDPTLDLDRVGIRFRLDDNDPLCEIRQVGGNAEIKCTTALLPGQRVNLNQLGLAPLTPVPGPAGTFRAVVLGHDEDQDAVSERNTATIAVEIVEAKPDLVATVRDAAAGFTATGTAQPITPGQTARLDWSLANFSPFVVTGVEFSAQLPEHVTFVTRFAGCTYSADGRQVTCNVSQLPDALDQGAALIPDPEHPWLIKVAPDAPGPIQPTGTFTGRATASAAAADASTMAAADPSPFSWLTTTEPARTEPVTAEQAATEPPTTEPAADSATGPGADASAAGPDSVSAAESSEAATAAATEGDNGDADAADNTDEFTVFIGQGSSPSPSPSQSGGTGGTGGGLTEDELPITGTDSRFIAGVGAALLVAGLIVVLMVRRPRRS